MYLQCRPTISLQVQSVLTVLIVHTGYVFYGTLVTTHDIDVLSLHRPHPLTITDSLFHITSIHRPLNSHGFTVWHTVVDWITRSHGRLFQFIRFHTVVLAVCLARGGWSHYWFIIERTFLMTSAHKALLVRKLWSVDSAGWTGLKRPCIAWLAQRRACNNMTNLLWASAAQCARHFSETLMIFINKLMIFKNLLMMFMFLIIMNINVGPCFKLRGLYPYTSTRIHYATGHLPH